MGGFEPEAKPWNVDPHSRRLRVPAAARGLGPVRDPDDATRSTARPASRPREVKMLLNGPESFTPRRQLHPRRGARARRLFRLRRLQLGRHRQLRRRRQADRRVDRRRRGAARPLGRRHPPLRAVPRQPPAPRRPHRRVAGPALRDALAARGAGDGAAAAPLAAVRPAARRKGAVFGTKIDWERANYFLPPGATPPPHTFGTPGWLPQVLDEQRACREDVVVFDQTSFSKFVLKGRDALAVLQRLCANEIDVPVGRMVYTAMLNARGGFESDLTVIRARRRASSSSSPARRRRRATSPGSSAHIGDRRARGAGRRDQRAGRCCR